MTSYRPLDEGWTLSGAGYDGVAAQVPGCVHLDLMSSGHIPDPYLGDNESELDWIGKAEWTYRTTFDWRDDGSEFVDLECDGLDTVATIELNGVGVGRPRTCTAVTALPSKSFFSLGTNELSITFGSVYAYTQKWQEQLGARPAAYTEPFNFIRKMACNFGWDWGPTLVTAGHLAADRAALVVGGAAGRGPSTHDGDCRSRHRRRARPAGTGRGRCSLSASIGGQTAQAEIPAGSADSASVTVTVPDPRAVVAARLRRAGALRARRGRCRTPRAKRLDSWSRPVGLPIGAAGHDARRPRDAVHLVVNDVPVFVRGANWIPDDCFPSRITRERLAAAADPGVPGEPQLSADLGRRPLRVGGLLRPGRRARAHGRAGLPVLLRRLPGGGAVRLRGARPRRATTSRGSRRTPAWSCGRATTRCLWGFADWGWPEQLDGKSWGRGYYYDLLPRVVAELDPTRPYWPGSPYSGSPRPASQRPGARQHAHLGRLEHRRLHPIPRLHAHGSSPSSAIQARRPTLRHRCANAAEHPEGDRRRPQAAARPGRPPARRRGLRRLALLHPAQPGPGDNPWGGALPGAEPVCMGAIVWQLNDCWPVTSWSAVDGDGRLKPLWYALRHAFADRLLTIQPARADLRWSR